MPLPALNDASSPARRDRAADPGRAVKAKRRALLRRHGEPRREPNRMQDFTTNSLPRRLKRQASAYARPARRSARQMANGVRLFEV
jgi:hypothetical protein